MDIYYILKYLAMISREISGIFVSLNDQLGKGHSCQLIVYMH